VDDADVPRRFEAAGELNAFLDRPDDRPVVAELLANLKRDHEALVRLLDWVGRDHDLRPARLHLPRLRTRLAVASPQPLRRHR
jgi:hypothetical protein